MNASDLIAKLELEVAEIKALPSNADYVNIFKICRELRATISELQDALVIEGINNRHGVTIAADAFKESN